MMSDKKAFTLVELLVVITLIAILGTISFITFNSKVGEARDGKRQTDLNEIVNVLELYQTEQSEFPEPSNFVDITYSGSAIAWKQGTFGESVAKDVKLFGQDYPIDPRYEVDYTYSVTSDKKEFQIAAISEVNIIEDGLGEEISLLPSAHAAPIKTAFVMGDYNGFMVRAKSAGTDYFIASPSIIATDISNTDIVDIITNKKLVYKDFFNLPASYSGFLDLEGGFDFNVSDPLVYEGRGDDLKSEQTLLLFNEKLIYIYATTPTESFDKYISVLEKEGLTSLKGFLTRKFKITFREYFNCKDILEDGADDGDRIYIIDPDGPGGEDEYEVFCDMTTDGGGWTRVGDNHIQNGNFAGGIGVMGAIENDSTTNNIVALSTPIDENEYALHQTGNYSSNYEISFDNPDLLKQGYELRMSMWRSDYDDGVVTEGASTTHILPGKTNNYTLTASTFSNFNQKMNYAPNFGSGGLLTDIDITVGSMVNTVTNTYLDGGILFDGFIASPDYSSNTYSNSEIESIDDWVNAGGFLLSTNDDSRFDPLGTYYNMPSGQIWQNVSKYWEIQNVDHPLVNGSIGLKDNEGKGIDLRGKTLIGEQNYSALMGTPLPDDIILARDKYSPYLPTVILRKLGKGNVLITADEGIFRNMSSGNTFESGDNEDAFAAAIMAYAIETAAGINPHEGYAFHNRLYYNDGTFSTNGEDKTLETMTVDGKVWTKELVRHKIYKTPDTFNWYLGLDANNNKDLYFTGLRLELFYR